MQSTPALLGRQLAASVAVRGTVTCGWEGKGGRSGAAAVAGYLVSDAAQEGGVAGLMH